MSPIQPLTGLAKQIKRVSPLQSLTGLAKEIKRVSPLQPLTGLAKQIQRVTPLQPPTGLAKQIKAHGQGGLDCWDSCEIIIVSPYSQLGSQFTVQTGIKITLGRKRAGVYVS